MPGTIQVSVLDFKGLSSSSNSSSLFIKVSMGKNEYQTSDRGEFSFPLTTLREDLIVTLQDAEGTEISRTCVQTVLVVEKGSWEDLFPLEGGGHVHMKLQFILSEEERNRIRTMRESALKKKLGVILNGSLRYSETSTVAGGSVASSKSNREISDSQTRVTYDEVVSIGDVAVQDDPVMSPGTFRKNSQSINGNKEGTIQKQTTPIRREESSSIAPISQAVEVHYTEAHHRALAENIETRLPHAAVPTKPTAQQEASSMLGSSASVLAAKSNLISPKAEDDPANKTEKRDPLEKTPSSVRKMIRAFEGCLAQDTKPRIRPPLAKSQSNRSVGVEGLSKDQDSRDITKLAAPSSGRLRDAFLIRDSQQTGTNITERGGNVVFDVDLGSKPHQATWQLKESSETHTQSKETDSSMVEKFEAAHKEWNTKEWVKTCEGLRRSSTFNTATVSGVIHEEHSGRLQPCELSAKQQDSGGTSDIEAKRKGIRSNYLHKVDIQVASKDKQKSVTYCKDEHYSFEGSGTWLFLDDTRHLCITTGGKKVRDLFDGCHIESKANQGKKSFSLPDNLGKHCVPYGTDDGIKKGEKPHHKLRKSRIESSADSASTGPVRQAIKVAIMVGFGTLVLLTRQREPRKSNATEEGMDLKQWKIDRLKLSNLF